MANDEGMSARLDELRRTMNTRLDTIEHQQRAIARKQLRAMRALPEAAARALTEKLTKRAAVVLGIGIVLGSALGGVALELARRLLAWALGVR